MPFRAYAQTNQFSFYFDGARERASRPIRFIEYSVEQIDSFVVLNGSFIRSAIFIEVSSNRAGSIYILYLFVL